MRYDLGNRCAFSNFSLRPNARTRGALIPKRVYLVGNNSRRSFDVMTNGDEGVLGCGRAPRNGNRDLESQTQTRGFLRAGRNRTTSPGKPAGARVLNLRNCSQFQCSAVSPRDNVMIFHTACPFKLKDTPSSRWAIIFSFSHRPKIYCRFFETNKCTLIEIYAWRNVTLKWTTRDQANKNEWSRTNVYLTK